VGAGASIWIGLAGSLGWTEGAAIPACAACSSTRARDTSDSKAIMASPSAGILSINGSSAVAASPISSAVAASPINPATSGEAVSVPLRTWLSRFSNSQEKSPITVAPTTRPLPLRV